MISDKEIETVGETYGLTPTDVEKDYVHGWLLDAIYSRPALAQALVLKGGNGLRKAYLPDTRFSKDLDFSTTGTIPLALLEKELRAAISVVEANTGVRFLDKVVVEDKNIFEVQAVEARLYFRGFYNDEKIDLKAQLDITQFDRILLPVQSRRILHPYSDAPQLTQTMKCQKAEEILASKLTTLLHRCKATDLFDLAFGVLRGGFGVSRSEVITTFLKKSIFENSPHEARSNLLNSPLVGLSDFWKTLPVPRISMFGFDVVLAEFPGLINSLFDAIAGPALAGAGAGHRGFVLPPRLSVRTPHAALGHFGSNVRETILQAGRAMELVEIAYDGFTRLVEPYRLAYKARKDGTGHEYFWGFDTSGGRSREVSMKSFFANKITHARVSGQRFSPRYPVEF
ncbi:nucleotidyl transferase AbiEii/AbiGii toxin family protein [Mesorhizobium sp. AR02]|uniref:nucleotidyl transferase AbiEii/AbiGii toxin family protein n=1 Tax=Mesorhizobium sp. AR02 TaxID=2865837 RepID=UPI00215E8F6F|nr:nucleotidyl transferase AbiEii/AbiGii toxin family protein [Mesorhizobium sp. AR02]UVK55373.1 nucleotidyl transferase AbiEii/AbiGii toxin family protein [Mesorhizobium sp. AR02]